MSGLGFRWPECDSSALIYLYQWALYLHLNRWDSISLIHSCYPFSLEEVGRAGERERSRERFRSSSFLDLCECRFTHRHEVICKYSPSKKNNVIGQAPAALCGSLTCDRDARWLWRVFSVDDIDEMQKWLNWISANDEREIFYVNKFHEWINLLSLPNNLSCLMWR